MTEPGTTGVVMGSLPVYLRVGDGPEQQVGALTVPDGTEPPTNAEIGRLLHQVADNIAKTPDGVRPAGVAMSPRD